MCHEEPKLCALVWEVPTSGTFTACSSSATVMRLAVCFSSISLGTCNFSTKAQFLKPILLIHKTVPLPSPPPSSHPIPSQLIPSPMLPPTHTSFPSLSPRSHSKYPDAAVPSHVSAPAYAIQWSLTKSLCSDVNTKHTIGKKQNKRSQTQEGDTLPGSSSGLSALQLSSTAARLLGYLLSHSRLQVPRFPRCIRKGRKEVNYKPVSVLGSPPSLSLNPMAAGGYS